MDPSALSSSIAALRSSIKALESASKSLESLLYFFVALVAIGVVLEVVFVVWEYRENLEEYHRGTIRSPSKPSTWKLSFELLGAVLVAIGVAGEFGVDVESGTIQTSLRNKNGELFQLLEGVSSAALERASTADLKRTQLQAKLVKLFGPRDLNTEQLGRITTKLSKFAGTKVDVYGIGIGIPWNKSESEESIRVAGQLVGALRAARIDAVGWTVKYPCVFVAASNLIIDTTGVPTDTRFASTLLDALGAEVDTFPEFTTGMVILEAVGCEPQPLLAPRAPVRKPDAALRIVIGRKITSLLTPEVLELEPATK